MGVAIGDINNDGLPDVLLTQYGGTRLFLNLGNRKFRDITEEAGLRNPLWGTSAAFFDYDRDGRLDLVVINYVDYDPTWDCTSPAGVKDFCAPKVFTGTASKLFHNLGPGPGSAVRFEDVSVSSGIGRIVGPGLGGRRRLQWRWLAGRVRGQRRSAQSALDQSDERHLQGGSGVGVAYNQMGSAFAGMGVALGDIDNDGLLDLYVSHLTSESNTL